MTKSPFSMVQTPISMETWTIINHCIPIKQIWLNLHFCLLYPQGFISSKLKPTNSPFLITMVVVNIHKDKTIILSPLWCLANLTFLASLAHLNAPHRLWLVITSPRSAGSPIYTWVIVIAPVTKHIAHSMDLNGMILQMFVASTAMIYPLLVGGLEHVFYFPNIWDDDPIWLSYFSGGETTN